MMLLSLYLLVLCFCKSYTVPTRTTTKNTKGGQNEQPFGDTRRIMKGGGVFDTRPYMVYLRPTSTSNDHEDINWLCGGVIIDERYILTSAACIEDIKYFYVVTGTHRWLPSTRTNRCIENGALRAIWKCVHRTYRFDGRVFNNIRWMVNDIAVVMTEGAISFTKKVKGCDYIPKMISYNNITADYEKPGIEGFIAGWGSTDKYTDAADFITRTSVNSPFLMEAEVVLITKNACKARWLSRYHSIIDKYMICGKAAHGATMSDTCDNSHVECRQLVYSQEEGPRVRRFESNPDKLLLHSAAQVKKREKTRRKTRRMANQYGGFCEVNPATKVHGQFLIQFIHKLADALLQNDHGGPLVVGRGRSAIVVGIISAYRVKNNSKNCYGPFLYTSVYNNRHLIHCAIYKSEGPECLVSRDQSSVLEEETFDWGDMPFRARTLYEDEEPVLHSGNDTNTPVNEEMTLGATDMPTETPTDAPTEAQNTS